MRYFFNKLQIVIQFVKNVILYGDNEISITLTKNAKSQYSTKHIDVQYHYIQKLIEEGELKIERICNTNILADKFTKVLSIKTFRHHQASHGIAL